MATSKIDSLKEKWGNNNSFLEDKVSNLYGEGVNRINPFLNKNGEIFNKFIDYQRVLDNPKTSLKTKQFIINATGLTPKVEDSAAVNVAPSNTNTVRKATPATDTGTNLTANNIAESAHKYIGTPYVWGGESMAEGGMDCSGFVYNALKDAGYNIGRTTAQGYRAYGTVINKTDMQPGDLVFFGKNGKASHIGIYLGNGQMIHSSGGSKNTKNNPGKGVSITDVNYRNDFIEARRY